MTEDASQSVLDHDRLASTNDKYEAGPTFNASMNANGEYETMRFVLRLNPRPRQALPS